MHKDANHKDKAVYVIQRWFIKNRGKKYYLFSFIPIIYCIKGIAIIMKKLKKKIYICLTKRLIRYRCLK